MSLPPWFLGEIPTELLRLARANCEEPVHRQIFADWVERYGGEDGRLLCRFFRRDPIVRHDASTWQTLSASEARLVEPFSDLVLGIGDRVVLPLTETQSITMGWVPAGNSWLGGGKKGGQSFHPKKGLRAFTLEKCLWCSIYPVTQEQWQAVMGNNPSHFHGRPNNPVEQVSYKNVQEFLHKLNAANSGSGYLYRLPTANEWEYILRGGPIPKSERQHEFHPFSKSKSRYDFYFARSKTDLTALSSNDLSFTQANFRGNVPAGAGIKGPNLEATSAVGNYLPNSLGMYDMHGNVWEWTCNKDGSGQEYHGGSWNSNGTECAASNRLRNDPVNRLHSHLGFRLLAVPVEE